MRKFYTGILAEEAFSMLKTLTLGRPEVQDLLKRLNRLQQEQEKLQHYRDCVKDSYLRDGELEMDQDAIVSIDEDQGGEEGAYVQTWHYVGRPEASAYIEAPAQEPKKITQILFFPKDKGSVRFDVHGIFDPDPLGYTPPKVVFGGLTRNDNESPKWYLNDVAVWTEGARAQAAALPLLWDGKEVYPAVSRAVEVLQRVLNIPIPHFWDADSQGNYNLGYHKGRKISEAYLGEMPEGLTVSQMSAWALGRFCVQTLGGQLIVTTEVSDVSSR